MPDPQRTTNPTTLMRCVKLAAGTTRAHSKFTDISLELDRGELQGIIGSNPVEISLLLQILAGLNAPQSGTVQFEDRPLALHGALVTQVIHYLGPAWTPPGIMTPHELLTFTGKLQKMTGKTLRTSTQDMLDHLGISALARQPLYSLANAHRQLACFGSVMMGQPKLIILDQFDRDLSILQQDLVWQIIDDKRQHDAMAFIVTPTVLQRLATATRVAILKDSTLFANESPQGIMQRFRAQPRVEIHVIEHTSISSNVQKTLQRFGDVQLAGTRLTITLAEEYATAGIPVNITVNTKSSRRQAASATTPTARNDDSWLLDEHKMPGTIGLTLDTILQTVGRDNVKAIWIIPPSIEQAFRNAMQGA